MTDGELVARVLAGDGRAFEALVARHYDDCYRFARRMLGCAEDAEDAVQEAFLRVHRHVGRYREQDNFRAWVFRILVNQCRTLGGRNAKRARRFVSDSDAVARATVAGQEEGADLRDLLQKCLGELSETLREVALLRFGEEMEYSEMAAITGLSIPALKMRVLRAREVLRGMLGGGADG
jgi:RNA polymerase sigma-70 factor (ECF subfamily)